MPPMQPAEFIRGRRVSLGPIDLADIDTYVRWINDPAIRPYVNRPWPTTAHEERRRIETLVAAENAVGFAIHLRDGNRLIGRTAIWNIHRVNRSGLFTIYIGDESMRSRGLGKEATALTTLHAMEGLNLNRLELEVFAYNERALHVYEWLGFRQEGVRREAKFHAGRYHDAIQMAILKRDWSDELRARFRSYLDGTESGAVPAPGATPKGG